MAERLASEPGVEVLNQVELNQFVVQFGTDVPPEQRDPLTRAVIQRVQAAGVCYVAEASWHGRIVMRVSVISWATNGADIDQSADSIAAAWRQVKGSTTVNDETAPRIPH